MKIKAGMALLALVAAGITAWAVSQGADTGNVLIRLGVTGLFLAVGLVMPSRSRLDIEENDYETLDLALPEADYEQRSMAVGAEHFTWEPPSRGPAQEHGPRQF